MLFFLRREKMKKIITFLTLVIHVVTGAISLESQVYGQSDRKVLMFLREGYSYDLDLMLKMEVGTMTMLVNKAGFQVDVATYSGQPVAGKTEKIEKVMKLSEIKQEHRSKQKRRSNRLLSLKDKSAVLNEGEVTETIIGRGDLGVRMIDMGLGVEGLRFGNSERGPRFHPPTAQVLEDLLCDLWILDERNGAHWPLALGAGQGVYLVYFLDKSCPVPEVPFELLSRQPNDSARTRENWIR
jgi:hypothetical protein